ncbi:AAA family ATPase [Fangia hongkongensis]|uniref:AAA family ATPase n=3 Tax=Fangia hongkongensis TaxID=270495 RepID=UPI00037F245F|nr:ATP-binding protein [Fangia hongkongensis]
MSQKFTLAIAKGESFCNRTQEKKALSKSINHAEHTVIIAPRRYGKTSLISEVIRLNDYKHVWFDFLKAIDTADVIHVICKKLSNLIGQMTSDLNAIKGLIYKFFAHYKPEFISTIYGQSVKLSLQEKTASPEDIADLLLSIDQLAISLEIQVVIVCDEFQQMYDIDKSGVLQAAIRHAAERSERVAYIFSGSSRHMLEVLFMDKSKPLYRLCKIMKLDKIELEHYYDFIEKAAKERWGSVLPKQIMDEILVNMTELHPYYVNYLCMEIWDRYETIPSMEQVKIAWASLCEQIFPYIKEDVKGLSPNQKRVLKYLSQYPFGKTLDQTLLVEIGIRNYSSAKQALEYLKTKDLIYYSLKDNQYHIYDPLLRKYLR